MDHHQQVFRCVAFALIVTGCLAAQKGDVCNGPKDFSCGPIPPPLPESYELFYEEANLVDSSAFWFEEYFDYKNLRIKRKTVARGHEFHQLADYNSEQVVSYQKKYPGAIPLWDVGDLMSCTVEDIRSSKFVGQFGYRTGDIHAPHRMYTSNLALKYGGPYKFAYDNSSRQLAERGTSIQQFVGCVYDEVEDSTTNVAVAWSTADVVSPSGESPTLLQIKEEGGRFVPSESSSTPTWKAKSTVKEIAWYSANANMGERYFQLPPLMHCSGMKHPMDLPTVPRAYSVRADVAIWTEEMKGDRSIIYDNSFQYWYDEDLQLVRVDIYPSLSGGDKVKNIFKVNEPLTAILDYNTGLVFVSVHRTRACTVHQIVRGMPFWNKYTFETPLIAPGESLFEIDSDTKYVYKGKREIRGILCDVWSADQTPPDARPEEGKSIVEIAFAANDWRSATDEVETSHVPVQVMGLHARPNAGVDVGMSGSTSVINFYKFKGTSSPLSVYDIGECFFHHVQRYFTMQFPAKYRIAIESNHATFLDAAQYSLMLYSDLGTVLRVQNLEYMFSERAGTCVIAFALLERLPNTRYSRGLTVKEAVDLLTLFVNDGNLVIPLEDGTGTPSQPPQVVNVTAIPGSFKEVALPSQTTVRRSALDYHNLSGNVHARRASLDVLQYAADDDKPSGYTPGAVAGMAIGMLILGLIAGAVGMVFYLRRNKPTSQYSHEMK